jgi:hypothetical protein
VAEGAVSYYALPCLSFAIDGGSAARVGITHQQFLEIVEAAFTRWSSVDCPGGGKPGFLTATAGVVEVAGNHFCSAVPEANLGVWTFPEKWTHPSSSVGFTTLWLGGAGNVLDADVELNADWFGGRAGELTSVLLTVATHEAGHVLGIDHSQESSALMAAAYSDGLMTDRNLGPDDVDAICTLYPPASSQLRCPAPIVRDEGLDPSACRAAVDDGAGCSFEAPVRASQLGFAAVALLAALALKRRRS